MRTLIQQKICNNWLRKMNHMDSVARSMGWELGEPQSKWVNTTDWNQPIGPWILQAKKDNSDFQECLTACSDEALLIWLEEQHKQGIY